MKRQTVKRIALVLGALLLLAIGSMGLFVASEWTYISRMRSHPANSILEVAWYQPKEAVPGVEHPVPLPVAEGLAPDAFAEAVQLAEAKNAAALLVVHKGRVVLERHWNGYGYHTLQITAEDYGYTVPILRTRPSPFRAWPRLSWPSRPSRAARG